MNRSKIQALFTQSIYEREGNYTKYKFTLKTRFTDWQIVKRYSEFDTLHKKLMAIQKENTIVPQLPSKIFWKKNLEINVQKRGNDLEKYLNGLLSTNFNSIQDPALDFIEIEDEVYCILITAHSFNESSKNSFHPSLGNELSFRFKSLSTFYESCGSQNNVYSNLFLFNKKKSTVNEGKVLVIEEFLRNLEENKENQGEIVQVFQNFFDEHIQEQFSLKEISMLFRGIKPLKQFEDYLINLDEDISVNKFINGLLYHIGNYEENMLGSKACLELLLKLLNCNKNYDYERYILFFKSIDIKYISMIKLKELIKCNHFSLSQLAYELCHILFSNQFEMSKLLNYNDYIIIMEDMRFNTQD